MAFDLDAIPNLFGKRALITGGTGGLGFETAKAMAKAGATVVLIGRSEAKGATAIDRIMRATPEARISFCNVNLASLASIRSFGKAQRCLKLPIDILVNNAGLMAPPKRMLTEDGFELQFGTNHLGHFALTGVLLPLLGMAPSPRVVTISSGIAAFGKLDFGDLQSERSYNPNAAYMQSKLANLLFTRALQYHSDEGGWNILSLAAHPGHARTDLIANGAGKPKGAKALFVRLIQAVASHDAASGALPALMAATAPDVEKLDYFGPTGLLQQKGPPGRVAMPKGAEKDDLSARLWRVSEQLTGVWYGRIWADKVR